MPKPKSENIKVKKKIKKLSQAERDIIAPNDKELKNEHKSNFSAFTKRPLPSEKEVRQLDDYIENEVKEGEVTDSLSEIYQDDKGEMIDVEKFDIKRRGFFSWLLTSSLFLFIISGLVFLAYNYLYIPSLTDSTAVILSISGDEEVFVGEEFSYTIIYKNESNVVLENVDIEIKYPDNFVILDATPGSENFRRWHFNELGANFNGKITVKGKIIAPTNYSGIMLANITYTPANFSSEFKKESSFVSTVLDTGINFSIDYISSLMVNEESEITIRFKEQDESYIKNFRLTVEPLENADFINYEPGEGALYNIIRPGVFDVNEIQDGEGEVLLKLKFSDKLNDSEELVFNFAQADSNGDYKIFHSETISIDVIKSDLSLTLIINAKKNDQGASFSDKLNYSIVYSNKGETEMNDVIVMVVLDSEFLDWDTLSDLNGGDISGNTITWSKEEIEGLENLGTRDEGFIDFSISLVDKPSSIFPEKNYSVESYAQYRTASSTAEAFLSETNKSNIIINKISSDLELSERIMYFNDDNISVGSGPIPPKVGQVTEYRVYWDLSNNLHELDNVSVSLNLPGYVTYVKEYKTSSGSIVFVPDNNSLTWEIGKMPITAQNVRAEFAISVKPTDDHLNKIMILSPGAVVSAHDSEANIELGSKGEAKTTRLEDDSIGASDGIVRE